MAEKYTRGITIYINGKEVENSIKGIRGEMQHLINAQAKMTIGSKEYINTGQDIKKLGSIIKQHNDEIRNTSSVWDKVKSFLPIASFAALGATVFNFGKKLINATDVLQDKFQIAVEISKNVTDTFLKTIGNGQGFKTFINGLFEAAKAGKEYAEAMDIIEDRSRSLSIKESETKLLRSQQVIILRSALSTYDQQVEAATKIINAEDELIKTKKDIAIAAKNARLESFSHLGITEDIVKENLVNYELNKDIIKQADEYNSLLKERKDIQSMGGMYEKSERYQEINKQIANTKERIVKFAEMRTKFTNLNGKQLDELGRLYAVINDSESEILLTQGKIRDRVDNLIVQERKLKDAKKETHEIEAKAYNGKDPEKPEPLDEQEWLDEQLKAREDYEKRRSDLIIKYRELSANELKNKELELLEKNKKYVEDLLLKQLDNGLISRQEYDDKIADIDKTAGESRTEINSYYDELILKNSKESQQKQIEMRAEILAEYQSMLETTEEIFNSFHEVSNVNLETQKNKELAILEAAYEKQVAAAGNNSTQLNKINEKYAKDKNTIDDKYAKKSKEIAKKYALIELIAGIASAVASNAQSITKIWAGSMSSAESIATWGGAGVAKAGLITGLLVAQTLAQIGLMTAKYNQVKQLAAGKYDVVGAMDGKTYRNVPSRGPVKGIELFEKPTLIADYGPELAFDADHTRKFVLSPYFEPVMALRSKQLASGDYSTVNQAMELNTGSTVNQLAAIIERNNYVISAHNRLLEDIRKNPLKSQVVFQEIKDANKTFTDIENYASGR